MIKQILLFASLVIFSTQLLGQTYTTQAREEAIHTIQVKAGGRWDRLPVIDLKNDDFVQINFDVLGKETIQSLSYRIVNCNADWTRSRLSEIEYIDGFNSVQIEDYAQSINTNVEYTNYNIEIPNDRQRLKLSGNYVVEVYNDKEPDKVLLTACFSAYESQIQIIGTVSSNTDLDVNKEHQQVSFSINPTNLHIRDPFSDLKVFVRQNNRTDNQKSLIKPTYIQGDKLIYEHNRNLIFEAGNEYRRFETVSYRYNGLNIARTEMTKPIYTSYIVPDKVRAQKRYIYDQDQNGRYLIRNAEVADADIEADYFRTVFTLPMEAELFEPIYLNGAFTEDNFSNKYLMKYDNDKKEYSLSLLLKQGAYNYQYLVKKNGSYSPFEIEGNYFETQNEYTIYVYYRPLGFLSDQLIGFLSVDDR